MAITTAGNGSEVKKTTTADQEISPALDTSEINPAVSDSKAAELAKTYESQKRQDYDTYFDLMNRTTGSKLGVGIVYLPVSTKPSSSQELTTVADLGSGSGELIAILAKLYSGTKFVGVDLSPQAISHANKTYVEDQNLGNLSYIAGDVAELNFMPNSLDAVFTSSTIHHLTTFSGKGFNPEMFNVFMDSVVAQLKEGGIFINRDFVVPDLPREIYMDLLDTDGANNSENVKDLSTAARFERFARDFRSSQNRDHDVPYEKLESPHEGFVRYKLSSRAATEYLLHKDYGYTNQNWRTECNEEYLYKTQAEMVAACEERGMRVIQAVEVHNPWIVNNRFEGKAMLSDLDGKNLSYPPTNFMMVAEKVGDGVLRLEQRSHSTIEQFATLEKRCFQDKASGHVFEVVGLAKQREDLLPWYEENGSLYVVVQEEPKPVIQSHEQSGNPNLDRSYLAGYVPGPLSHIVAKGDDFAWSDHLQEHGVNPEQIQEVGTTQTYFTSPGGINEVVAATAVKIDPDGTHLDSNSKVVEARRFLGSCQAGGVPDNRLEVLTYKLLLAQGKDVGPWIGAELKLEEQNLSGVKIESAKSVLTPQKREAFTEVGPERSKGFLEMRLGEFVATNRHGDDVPHTRSFQEYVTCSKSSDNTISILPVMKGADGIYVGLEIRDLPVPQIHTGSSHLTAVPAFRIPRNVTELDGAIEAAVNRAERDFKMTGRKIETLGGKYYPSPESTSEVVYPTFMEVDAKSAASSDLRWVKLDDLISNMDSIRDGHLITAACRAAHALGILKN